jgi:hypothetical protein
MIKEIIYQIEYLDKDNNDWLFHSQYSPDIYSKEQLIKLVANWNLTFKNSKYRLIKVTRTETVKIIK